MVAQPLGCRGAGAATGGTAVARGEWPSDPIVQIGLFLGVATPAGLGGWLKLRDEMRTTEATQDSTFRERIAISDEIGGLRDKGVDEDDARLLTRLDFRKRLDERLAQFELLDRAPTGEVSPDPEVTTTATKLEVDELRRLLDESRLTTDILDARRWYLRGNALLAADRNEDALTAFDRAIASEPDVHQVHNNRGTVLGMLGRFEEGDVAYRRAIELSPESSSPHFNRGVSLGKMGRWKDSLQSYDRAIELQPSDSPAHNNRGAALSALERHDEALAEYDRTIELKPDQAGPHLNRGMALSQLGRHDESLAAFDEAITIDPTNGPAFNGRGDELAELDRAEEALAALDHATELDRDDPRLGRNRAIVLAALGRYRDALAEIEQRLELSPDDEVHLYNRGVALALLKRYAEALASVERAYEIGFDDFELAETHPYLEALRSDPEYGPKLRELIARYRPADEDETAGH